MAVHKGESDDYFLAKLGVYMCRKTNADFFTASRGVDSNRLLLNARSDFH